MKTTGDFNEMERCLVQVDATGKHRFSKWNPKAGKQTNEILLSEKATSAGQKCILWNSKEMPRRVSCKDCASAHKSLRAKEIHAPAQHMNCMSRMHLLVFHDTITQVACTNKDLMKLKCLGIEQTNKQASKHLIVDRIVRWLQTPVTAAAVPVMATARQKPDRAYRQRCSWNDCRKMWPNMGAYGVEMCGGDRWTDYAVSTIILFETTPDFEFLPQRACLKMLRQTKMKR